MRTWRTEGSGGYYCLFRDQANWALAEINFGATCVSALIVMWELPEDIESMRLGGFCCLL